MTQQMVLQLINIVLLIVNGVVFFMPKKPISGVHSNASGILAVMALCHTFRNRYQAIHYRKIVLLRILTICMIPLSVMFWYFIFKL